MFLFCLTRLGYYLILLLDWRSSGEYHRKCLYVVIFDTLCNYIQNSLSLKDAYTLIQPIMKTVTIDPFYVCSQCLGRYRTYHVLRKYMTHSQSLCSYVIVLESGSSVKSFTKHNIYKSMWLKGHFTRLIDSPVCRCHANILYTQLQVEPR